MPEQTWAIIAGGGTAGHLLPGLAVAQALVERGHDASTIHFVGSDRGIEATLIPNAGFTLDELPGRGIQRRLALSNVGAVFGLVRGTVRGIRIVRRRRPSVVVVLGGHASLACGVGAVIARVPLVLVEQNVKAGAVNRILRRFAKASAVSLPGTDLPNAVVTGNPLRPAIAEAAAHPDRAAARAALDLPEDRTVIAVFSGSLGSSRINAAVRGLVERWTGRSDIAIRHVIGHRDWADYSSSMAEQQPSGLRYQCIEYEDRMHLLLQAADIAVTRAGGTVAELAALGVPSILVPLPIATRDHQLANAQVLEAAGGAITVLDADLDVDRLEHELLALITDRPRLDSMADAMRREGRLDAAADVAALIEDCARD